MKQMPTPYLIYCLIPSEQYEKLIDSQTQIKLVKEALQEKRNTCINAIYTLPYDITKEAQERFISELKRQGYRFINNNTYIEWDDWDNKRGKE